MGLLGTFDNPRSVELSNAGKGGSGSSKDRKEHWVQRAASRRVVQNAESPLWASFVRRSHGTPGQEGQAGRCGQRSEEANPIQTQAERLVSREILPVGSKSSQWQSRAGLWADRPYPNRPIDGGVPLVCPLRGNSIPGMHWVPARDCECLLHLPIPA